MTDISIPISPSSPVPMTGGRSGQGTADEFSSMMKNVDGNADLTGAEAKPEDGDNTDLAIHITLASIGGEAPAAPSAGPAAELSVIAQQNPDGDDTPAADGPTENFDVIVPAGQAAVPEILESEITASDTSTDSGDHTIIAAQAQPAVAPEAPIPPDATMTEHIDLAADDVAPAELTAPTSQQPVASSTSGPTTDSSPLTASAVVTDPTQPTQPTQPTGTATVDATSEVEPQATMTSPETGATRKTAGSPTETNLHVASEPSTPAAGEHSAADPSNPATDPGVTPVETSPEIAAIDHASTATSAKIAGAANAGQTPNSAILEAGQVEAAPTAPQSSQQPTPSQQVAEAIRQVRRLTDGSHRLSLELHPRDLGTVQLEIAFRDGQLHLHAVAETAAARLALEQSLPELRQELDNSGVKTGSLDVGADTGREANGDEPARQQRNSVPDTERSNVRPEIAATGTSPGGIDISL